MFVRTKVMAMEIISSFGEKLPRMMSAKRMLVPMRCAL